ncbi:MAG: site-specific DNA-methyltransferase [Anaerolineales bacterium]|nr:site-specific DNA-methyltransferase [Anaerolineales bacterium]
MPSLNWIGREAVERHHTTVPFHLLRAEPALSVGPADSGNLLVEGDNLVALKALLPFYAGQVKCIYIDPPYNTGNEGWVYNDNVNSPQMQEWLGKVVGTQGEDLSRHDKWLCMMYPRLLLLRELLSSDGAIFISIDDNEAARLRLVADEIFGEQNFIANIVWQKKQSPQNDAINISDMHDHILVYAKRAKQNRNDPKGWQRNLLSAGETQSQRYANPDNDPLGPWASADLTVNKTADERPNLYYAIKNPNTGKDVWPPSRRRTWIFEKTVLERLVAEGRVWWGISGTNVPRLKKYYKKDGGLVPSTWWPREIAGDNQEARREIRRIFGDTEDDVFPTPKPVRLVQRILELASQPGDIILDSFAGSGTTGHAVLQLNKAGGNRRFILTEMEPTVARTATAERLRRVIEGYANIEGLAGGFQYCTLGPTLFDAEGHIRAEVGYGELARLVFFSETGAALPKPKNGQTPLLGVHNGTAVYLLYNGILKDKSAAGGNALTRAVLAGLPAHAGPRVIYGTRCLLSAERLRQVGVTFKQIPTALRVE